MVNTAVFSSLVPRSDKLHFSREAIMVQYNNPLVPSLLIFCRGYCSVRAYEVENGKMGALGNRLSVTSSLIWISQDEQDAVGESSVFSGTQDLEM
jgi:hypothetical protein